MRRRHLVAGRWILALLGELGNAGRRDQDLHTALGSISPKVRTETLCRVERDAPVVRRVDRIRVETATWADVETARRSWSERTIDEN